MNDANSVQLSTARAEQMLGNWFVAEQRGSKPFSRFEVIDVTHPNDLSQEAKSYLTDMLLATRFTPDFLKEMADYLGWDSVSELIVSPPVPTLAAVKRGDFGEALLGAMLEEFHGYRVPVPKLRFKITADETQHATDILAIKLGAEQSITEVCFVEAKLRTGPDHQLAVKACAQLARDYESRWPDVLTFVAERLYERGDPLFNSFAAYLASRQDMTDKDTFRLGTCWDLLSWREVVLEHLEDSEVQLPGLTIDVVRIKELRALTDQLYAALGVSEIIDDD